MEQTTRMLKFEHENCPASEDGIEYVWRASAKSVADKAQVWCPCCGSKIANPHFEGEEDSEEGLADRNKRFVPRAADEQPSDRVRTGTVKSRERPGLRR